MSALLVASADLQLVQDLVGAIRAADANERAANAGRIPPVPPTPAPLQPAPAEHRPCDTNCCRPASESRPHVRNLACYSPCQPSHWKLPEHKTRLALQAPPAALAGPIAPAHKPAIQPPWAQQPWHEPAKQIVKVKVVVRHTDILTKGSLIDMFI
ncbi:MAG TPA: hypothetical protein VFE47_09115 [Tepidisphaeraceae bacterium]|nr:hypothetical protein [Tepidisphaeraceae bacterium]